LPGRAVKVIAEQASFIDTETGSLRPLGKGELGSVASVDHEGYVVAAFHFTGGPIHKRIGRRLSFRDEDKIGDVVIPAGSPLVEFGGARGSDATRWSSRADPTAGSYEATFVLPFGATDVQVSFDVVGGRECKVFDRKTEQFVDGGEREVFTFSPDSPVDALFELEGNFMNCRVVRAWNTAVQSHEPWEWWDPPDERPQPHPAPRTTASADAAAAAPPLPDSLAAVDATAEAATARWQAAAAELLAVQEQLLMGDETDERGEAGLRQMSKTNKMQHVSANAMGTISAGLAVAAIATIEMPPVAIAFSLASLGARAMRDIGDGAADAIRRGAMAELINLHKWELQGFLSICDEWDRWNRKATALRRPRWEFEVAKRRFLDVPDEEISPSVKADLIRMYAKLDGNANQGISLEELQQLTGQLPLGWSSQAPPLGQEDVGRAEQHEERRLDVFEFCCKIFMALKDLPPDKFNSTMQVLLDRASNLTTRGQLAELEPESGLAGGTALHAEQSTSGSDLSGMLRSAATTGCVFVDDLAIGAGAVATGLAEAGAVLGVVGAVFAVGFAAHEWRETKPAHAVVAAKIVELKRSNMLLRRALGLEERSEAIEDDPSTISLVKKGAKSLVDGAKEGAAGIREKAAAVRDRARGSFVMSEYRLLERETRAERQRAMAARLTKFYAIYNPDKLEAWRIDRVCSEYEGREEELNGKLRQLYEADLSSIQIEGLDTLAQGAVANSAAEDSFSSSRDDDEGQPGSVQARESIQPAQIDRK
jgi:hypothetical protein